MFQSLSVCGASVLMLVLYFPVERRDEAKAALEEGVKQLEVLRRQAILSQLYPSARSVME